MVSKTVEGGVCGSYACYNTRRVKQSKAKQRKFYIRREGSKVSVIKCATLCVRGVESFRRGGGGVVS